MNLFSIYIFIEIGDTGGGCFRYMYSRFLKGAAKIAGNEKLTEASSKIYESGKIFSDIGFLFKNAEKDPDVEEKIKIASEKFKKIAEKEEEAFNWLSASIT